MENLVSIPGFGVLLLYVLVRYPRRARIVRLLIKMFEVFVKRTVSGVVACLV